MASQLILQEKVSKETQFSLSLKKHPPEATYHEIPAQLPERAVRMVIVFPALQTALNLPC